MEIKAFLRLSLQPRVSQRRNNVYRRGNRLKHEKVLSADFLTRRRTEERKFSIKRRNTWMNNFIDTKSFRVEVSARSLMSISISDKPRRKFAHGMPFNIDLLMFKEENHLQIFLSHWCVRCRMKSVPGRTPSKKFSANFEFLSSRLWNFCDACHKWVFRSKIISSIIRV